MPYHKLFYHLVWTTWKREPLITSQNEALIYEAISKKCDDLGGQMLAIGGISDHVHAVTVIPPKMAIADFVSQLKGYSSFVTGESFGWQQEYAVFTISPNNLRQAISYVKNQKQHHADGLIYGDIEPYD